MRSCLFLLFLAGLGWSQAAQAAGGFAHSPDYIGRVNRNAFKGQSPEEVARYLGHFSGGAVGGAVGALAEGGEKNLPLVKKLLKDENPWIRGGAIRVLTVMYAPAAEAEGPAAPEMTHELTEVMGLVSSMQDDSHSEVQRCLGSFFRHVRVENELVYKVPIAQGERPMIQRTVARILLRAFLLSAFWVQVSFSRAADWPASAEDDQDVHLFILSGQSNMVELPGKYFTAPVVKAFAGQEVIVVKDASGGKAISVWVKPADQPDTSKPDPANWRRPGGLYDRLMDKVYQAVGEKKPTTVTFVWMQGERNGKSGTAPAVCAKHLKTVVRQTAR